MPMARSACASRSASMRATRTGSPMSRTRSFVSRLPNDMQAFAAEYLAQRTVAMDDYLALFDQLREDTNRTSGRHPTRAGQSPLVFGRRIAGAERSSTIRRRADAHASGRDVYQRDYALKRTGTTAVKHLHRLGLLGPHMTLGHGVWLDGTTRHRRRDRHLHLPQLQFEHAARQRPCAGDGIPRKGIPSRPRHRRSGHQRRPRHAARDAAGALSPPRARPRLALAAASRSPAHGDGGGRQDRLHDARRSAASRRAPMPISSWSTRSGAFRPYQDANVPLVNGAASTRSSRTRSRRSMSTAMPWFARAADDDRRGRVSMRRSRRTCRTSAMPTRRPPLTSPGGSFRS